MTTNALCRSYTRFLRTLHPRLGMAVYPDSRNPRDGVYWVTFDLTAHLRLKVLPLHAVLPILGTAHCAPGRWIVDALRALRWERSVADARRQFLHAEKLRRMLAAERVSGASGLTMVTVAS